MNAFSGPTRSIGFTLLELVTTLVLIGILAATAAPRFVDSDDAFAQRGYTDEIASTLRHARSVAVATECAVRVSITTTSYTAHQRTSQASCNDLGAWSTPVRRADGRVVQGTAPGSVHASGATTIVFDREGSIAAPEEITVGPFTISVDQESGLVSVRT